MQDLKIDGVQTFAAGDYGRLSIDGIGRCRGAITAASIDVDGIFRCEGPVKTGRLDGDGVIKIGGNVHAGEVDIDGILRVTGNAKLEATSINCDGLIRAGGEISADTIEAEGFIRAPQIVGDSVRIRSACWPFAFLPFKRSRISLIEATTVELKGVRAMTVNGRDITIGPGCRINNLDCSGTLTVSRRSRVKNITGKHTRRDS